MKKLRLLTIIAIILPMVLTANGCTRPDPPTIPFYLALQRGDLNQIERHILYGVDLDATDPDGRRPLHVAAETGRWAVAEILLKSGADMDGTDRQGRTPVTVALLAGRTQVAVQLIKRGAAFHPDELLRQATLSGVSDRDVVDFLLKRGADIDHRDVDGKTPLILAIEGDDRVMTKLLVSRGADVNLADDGGRRPLTVANEVGNQAIIRLLRQSGASEGTTP